MLTVTGAIRVTPKDRGVLLANLIWSL